MKPTKFLLISNLIVSASLVACTQGEVASSGDVSTQDNSSQSIESFESLFQNKLIEQGLSAADAREITIKAVANVSSNSSLDLNAILKPEKSATLSPLFLSGALTSITSLNGTASAGALIQPIVSSFMGVLGGNLGNGSSVAFSNLFSSLGSSQASLLPLLSGAGIPTDQILIGLGAGFTSGILQSGGSSQLIQIALTQLPIGLVQHLTSTGSSSQGFDLATLLGQFTSGAVSGIPVGNSSAALNSTLISQLLAKGSTQGLVGAGVEVAQLSQILSLLQISGLNGALSNSNELSFLTSIMKGSSLGSIAGLANGNLSQSDLSTVFRMLPIQTIPALSQIGISGTDMSSVILALTQGMTSSTGSLGLSTSQIGSLLSALGGGGVTGINLSGLIGGDLSAAMAALTQGSILGLVSNGHLNQTEIAALSQFGIMGGAQTLGLLSLFSGLNGNLNTQTLMQNLSSGALSGLASTGLGQSALQTGASNIAIGSLLGMLTGGIKMDNILNIFMPAISQGAETGLNKVGVTGNLFQLLMGAVMNVAQNPSKFAGN